MGNSIGTLIIYIFSLISLYSGDTLFLGEVGRPDLAVKSDLTQFDLAAMLYRSLKK